MTNCQCEKSNLRPIGIGGRFKLGLPVVVTRAPLTAIAIPMGYHGTVKIRPYTIVTRESKTQQSTEGELLPRLHRPQ